LNPRKEMSMNKITLDKTSTETHEMTGKCPFGGDRVGGAFGTPPTLENWYPDRLRVELLHQNGLPADPLGPDFDYAAEFAKLDFEALVQFTYRSILPALW
jgi:catalase-peroxidase